MRDRFFHAAAILFIAVVDGETEIRGHTTSVFHQFPIAIGRPVWIDITVTVVVLAAIPAHRAGILGAMEFQRIAVTGLKDNPCV